MERLNARMRGASPGSRVARPWRTFMHRTVIMPHALPSCRVRAVEYLRLRFGRWLGLAEKIGDLECIFCITQTGDKLVAAPQAESPPARRLQRQLHRDHHPTTVAAQHLTWCVAPRCGGSTVLLNGGLACCGGQSSESTGNNSEWPCLLVRSSTNLAWLLARISKALASPLPADTCPLLL